MRIILLFAVLGAAACAALPAFAQTAPGPDGSVVVPWGAWVAEFGTWAIALTGAAVAWLMRRLPSELVSVLVALRVDQLLDRAIQYGVNAVQGAVKDRSLTLEVGVQVAEQAMEYALEHAPMLVRAIGGHVRLREKVLARLNLDADAVVRPIAPSLTPA